MHPPILRRLVPVAPPAVGPLAEPGEVAPVPALLAIETLTSYLRSVDPRVEGSCAWVNVVVDHQIRDLKLLDRCEQALNSGRILTRGRSRSTRSAQRKQASRPTQSAAPRWQLRLRLDS